MLNVLCETMTDEMCDFFKMKDVGNCKCKEDNSIEFYRPLNDDGKIKYSCFNQ